MHLYSPILLGSLLVIGLVGDFQNIRYRSEQLQQSNSAQQYLLASNDACIQRDGTSPPPGCGRRE